MNRKTRAGLRAGMLLVALAATSVGAAPVSRAAAHYFRLSKDSAGTVAWTDEPYEWQTAKGKVLDHGATDADGHAAVSRVKGVSDYVLDTRVMRWEFHVDDACWTRAAALDGCAALTGSTNKGMQEIEAEEKATERAAEQAHARAIAEYRRIAAAGNDELAWLGPLPPTWSDEAYQSKLTAAMAEMERQLGGLKASDIDVAGFTCQRPEAFGPVPDQAAVVAYLAQRGGGSRYSERWPALVAAAKKGNWMARFQIYAALGNAREDDLVGHYRRLQLTEWLLKNRVGPVYFAFLQELQGSGYFDGDNPRATAPPNVYAALRGSYSAMDLVGEALAKGEDPQARAVGKRMHACARATMPVLFLPD